MFEYDIDYKFYFELVRKHLLENTLGKYMKKYIKKNFYPVIVGGVNITRCLESKPRTRHLISNLFTSDIDLDFVIIGDSGDAVMEQVHKERMHMLNAILGDKALKEHITTLENANRRDAIFTLNLRIDDSALSLPKLRVFKMSLVTVKLDFLVDGDIVNTMTIIDCPIYAKHNVEDYNLYSRFFQEDRRKPVPYYTEGGVMYATCGFIYYDTIRMMKWYENALDASTTPKERHFNFVKFVRYVIKFCALYMYINNLLTEKTKKKEIADVYKTAKQFLTTINVDDKYADISDEQRRVLKSIVSQLQQKTNLTKLQNVILGQTPQVRRNVGLRNAPTPSPKSRSA